MKNPFRKYQEDKVRKRLEIIEKVLKGLGRSRFEHLSALAATVAEQVTLFEKTEYELALVRDKRSADRSGGCEPRPLNQSTLMRNHDYKRVLIQHLAKTGVVSKQGVGPAPKEITRLREELDVASLRRDNERLRRYCRKLQEQLSERECGTPMVGDATGGESHDSADARIKAGLLAQAIKRILEYPGIGIFFEVDFATRTLDIKRNLRREGPLMTRAMAEAYFAVLGARGDDTRTD